MNTMYDVRQLLKNFGIFVYTGDKKADIEMMEEEIRELYLSNMLDAKSFQSAMILMRKELSKIQ
ncbi:hypothetical protein FIU87_14310 [Bacillus sp. THAF10]|uniref:YqgQ family protein n=1 Tax=Bacillus sp. THAF10 TaxID=2587848 RepID=UPI0012686940|nr:YqgQ family protein [Bacillus sp. THAF10]QFT89833.1 hypothetical protein FIU87_14310 [Bacillus sp. THAF10]